MKNTELAVYVSSYDGCADIWNTFFEIFEKYWKDCSYPVYLINNELPYSRNNVEVLHTGLEVNWFDRTIRSMEMLSETYVLFMLEDYFISKSISNDDFAEILSFMDQENIKYYQLSERLDAKGKTDRVRIPNKARYPISLQPAIWDRKYLLEVLKEIGGKSPWDFEAYYASESMMKKDYSSMGCYDTRDLLGYKNGVLRGKWLPDTVTFYRKQGLLIDTSKRGMLSMKKYYKYQIAVWVSRHTSEKLKGTVKKLLKAIKFDYLR